MAHLFFKRFKLLLAHKVLLKNDKTNEVTDKIILTPLPYFEVCVIDPLTESICL